MYCFCRVLLLLLVVLPFAVGNAVVAATVAAAASIVVATVAVVVAVAAIAIAIAVNAQLKRIKLQKSNNKYLQTRPITQFSYPKQRQTNRKVDATLPVSWLCDEAKRAESWNK